MTQISIGKPRRYCRRDGHDWSNWGHFVPEPVQYDFFEIIGDGPPAPNEIKAERSRICRDCGSLEIEDYSTGERRVLDSHGKPLGL